VCTLVGANSIRRKGLELVSGLILLVSVSASAVRNLLIPLRYSHLCVPTCRYMLFHDTFELHDLCEQEEALQIHL